MGTVPICAKQPPGRSGKWGLSPVSRGKPPRRGYALVLVVMLLFGLLGLAALVIDIGFARLAQGEMQTAVDSAALEGLGNGPATAAGRQQASQLVAALFSNATDSGGETVQYGAGPVVGFSGGIGDPSLAAGQLMQSGNPPVYQPGGLQANLDNAAEGDMVTGAYGLNAGYNAALAADEDAYYNRRDFTPSTGTARPRAPPSWSACGVPIIPTVSIRKRASVPRDRRCRSCSAAAA